MQSQSLHILRVEWCLCSGILVTGTVVLEALANCGTAAFDKTGTLTTGKLAATSMRGPEAAASLNGSTPEHSNSGAHLWCYSSTNCAHVRGRHHYKRYCSTALLRRCNILTLNSLRDSVQSSAISKAHRLQQIDACSGSCQTHRLLILHPSQVLTLHPALENIAIL